MINTPFDNPHAQAVAAQLRHTVANPHAPTMRIDYVAWGRINRMLWSKPIGIRDEQVEQYVQDFCSLTASISAAAKIAITADDLNWLIQIIETQDATVLTMLMAMVTMQPKDDAIALTDAAQLIGHEDTSTLRRWCADGRLLSARRIGDRTWTVARSELKLRYDL